MHGVRIVPLAAAGMALLLAPGCLAQVGDPSSFENPLLGEARNLYRQTVILEILQALEITPEQGQVLLQANADLVAAQQAMVNSLQSLVAANLRFMQAYVQGTLLDDPQSFLPANTDQADRILNDIGTIRSQYGAFCQQTYDRVYSVLTEAQWAAIETYEEQAMKTQQADMATTQGGSTLDALMPRLLSVRDMAPEAYQAQAENLAAALARRVVGDDPELAPRAAEVLLGLMEMARALPADADAEAISALREEVRRQLGLDAQGNDPRMLVQKDLVTQAGFENMLRDPVTSQVLASLLGIQTGGGAVQ